MAWWVIVLVVWVVASFAAAGAVALTSLRGRSSRTVGAARRPSALRAPGRRRRSVAAGGPAVRTVGPRGHRIPGAARRHRRR